MDLSRRRFLWLTAVATGGLAGCSASAPTKQTGQRTQPSGAERQAPTPGTDADASPVARNVAGQTQFGLELLTYRAARKPHANQFLSPYSIEVALAMTYAGAAGQTRDEMATTLNFHPRDRTLHPTVQRIRRRLGIASGAATTTPPSTQATSTSPPTNSTTTTSTTDETLRIESGTPFTFIGANSLWGQRGFPWRDQFLDTLERYYGAGLHEVDFEENYRQARRRINDWVATKTQDTIPELFPQGSLSRQTRLVLTNAVFFKANWTEEFDADMTEERPFTALDGTTTAVRTMARSEAELPYASVDGHQFVELPYAGGEFGMVVILPEAGTFESFVSELDHRQLRAYFEALEQRVGTIRLPMFQFGSELGLAEALADLGMPTAFRSSANFDPMGEGPAGDALALDDVRHETYIEIDEQGTVASAATGVEVALVSATVAENPFEMVVDRPFLFCIRHRETNLPVFLGRVADAAAAQST